MFPCCEYVMYLGVLSCCVYGGCLAVFACRVREVFVSVQLFV